MRSATALPLFHLYGDPPDDQAFDFVHVETLSSRSSIHNWTIQAHRHRNLFQIFVVERGGGETLACGTGICAAVVFGRNLGLLGADVAVHVPGGDLSVHWGGGDSSVWLTGPAAVAFEGQVDLP